MTIAVDLGCKATKQTNITFGNIMEKGPFAPKEQMLHFPKYFQIHDISKVSKGDIYGVMG